MKTYLLPVLFLFFAGPILALKVSVYPAVFYEGQEGYVEFHYFFSGATIGWKSAQDSMMQSSAQVVITFKQDGKIVKYDKYNISSPIVPNQSDFRDVHRYGLKPGKYNVDIIIADLSRKGNNVGFQTPIQIQPPTQIAVSDVLLLSNLQASTTQTNFDKYGYQMEALPFNYIDKNTSKIVVYTEIYHTDLLPTKDYSLRLQFESISNGQKTPYQGFTKKRAATSKDVYIKTLDVKFMPSGDYNLLVEVRDDTGQIIAQNKVSFHRDNPRMSHQTTIADLNGEKGNFIEKLSLKDLDYYLTALLPTLAADDNRLLRAYFKQHNTEAKKDFLYRHFSKIDPISPAVPFEEFASVAREVDRAYYSAFGRGFETDRGRIYMKYGAPNDHIRVEDEQFAYPYEIWIYEDLPNNNGPIKFLFYNRDRAGENFTLLHSNARGERQNKRWKQELFHNDSLRSFDFNNDRVKDSEVDDALNSHPNSQAIRYFQDL